MLEKLKTNFLSLSLSQAGVDNNILMRVAVFQVFPLELVGMLEINKKVISVLSHSNTSVFFLLKGYTFL